jgi:DNA excision repair protein ERCC-4
MTTSTQPYPTIIIDTREQRPYTFSEGITTLRSALPAGDYSIAGHETDFAVERKSLPDYLSTIIHAKTRFHEELRKLRMYDQAFIVVEAGWPDILQGNYERADRILPQAVLGITLTIMLAYDVPVIMAGDRPSAREIVEKLCLQYARRQEQLQQRALALCGV